MLRYKISLCDLIEMMAERGLSFPYTAIMSWVERCTSEFVKRWGNSLKKSAVERRRIFSLREFNGMKKSRFMDSSIMDVLEWVELGWSVRTYAGLPA